MALERLLHLYWGASNSQFLHVTKIQKHFASENHPLKTTRAKRNTIFGHFCALDCTSKILNLVGAGIVFQDNIKLDADPSQPKTSQHGAS
ncbi:hypothetical protein FSOLCH5_015275 [Fusarium solani]